MISGASLYGAHHYAHQGIQTGLDRFERSAADIADPTTSLQVSSVVELKKAQQEVAVNAQVMKIANEMTDHLIDIVA